MIEQKNIKPSVGIVGCGWLGKALTSELISQKHAVIVSTQQTTKIQELLPLGAKVECFSVSEVEPKKSDFQLSLFKQDCLIIAITPGIRHGRKDYADKIKNLVALAEAGEVKQLIMISSTAVYNGLSGHVDENCELDLSLEKTNILYQAEQQAIKFSGNTVILRLSGLVGPDRHPGKFLTSGRLLSDPQATTNLIHQSDAVGLLCGLINNPIHSAIYNGSSLTHVCKRDYYRRAAQVLGLPDPKFKDVLPSQEVEATGLNNKVINSSKIRKLLTYSFEYDDLLLWLNNT